MSSTDEDHRGGRNDRASRPPSAARERQRRRIWRTTRALAVGGVAATAAFVLAAAHMGGRAETADSTGSPAGDSGALAPLASGDDSANAYGAGESDSSGDGDSYSSPSIAPSRSAPTPSYSPPVARTGGS